MRRISNELASLAHSACSSLASYRRPARCLFGSLCTNHTRSHGGRRRTTRAPHWL